MTVVAWLVLAFIFLILWSIFFDAARWLAKLLAPFLLGLILVILIGLWFHPYETTRSLMEVSDAIAQRIETIWWVITRQ